MWTYKPGFLSLGALSGPLKSRDEVVNVLCSLAPLPPLLPQLFSFPLAKHIGHSFFLSQPMGCGEASFPGGG